MNLVCKLSNVKKLFKQLRDKSIETMKKCRCVNPTPCDQYTKIWKDIDTLAKPLYRDLDIMNELI